MSLLKLTHAQQDAIDFFNPSRHTKATNASYKNAPSIILPSQLTDEQKLLAKKHGKDLDTLLGIEFFILAENWIGEPERIEIADAPQFLEKDGKAKFPKISLVDKNRPYFVLSAKEEYYFSAYCLAKLSPEQILLVECRPNKPPTKPNVKRKIRIDAVIAWEVGKVL